ncbi:hypothetical protein KFU94_61550 [Chloroflexi bacterium TSY]|nr:hypothetical protein [Chloroflexi bacterium TSY]
MWAMLNGSFLKSRGAIHSALKESGFEDESWRSWWSWIWIMGYKVCWGRQEGGKGNGRQKS